MNEASYELMKYTALLIYSLMMSRKFIEKLKPF